MKLEFDPEADALYIRLRKGKVAYSKEVRRGVIVDYNRLGRPIGIELLGAAELLKRGVSIPDSVLKEVFAKSA